MVSVAARTIKHRIQRGISITSHVDGKRYVHTSDNGATLLTVTHASRATDRDAATQITTLGTELQERDYLRPYASQLTATLYRLSDKKALAPPQNPEPRSTPWWAFWRH